MRIFVICLALVSANVSAETFRCKAGILWDGGGDVVVIASFDDDAIKSPDDVTWGSISVAGVEYRAMYYVRGFDRRWDFGTKDNPTAYAFVIKTNGDGAYYDFSRTEVGETIQPKAFFACR